MRQHCRLSRQKGERRQVVLEVGSLGLVGLDLGEDSPALEEDHQADLEVDSHLDPVENHR